MLVSDRGSAFTAKNFESFLRDNNVRHVKIATGSPQANGQVERVNRRLSSMIAKISSGGMMLTLDKVLTEIDSP